MKIVDFKHKYISITLTKNQKVFLRDIIKLYDPRLQISRSSISLPRFNRIYCKLSYEDKNRLEQCFNVVKLRSGHSRLIDLPFEIDVDEDICELYGYLTGDGTTLRICRFFNYNNTIKNRIDELLLRRFAIKSKQEPRENSLYIPKIVLVILESIFGEKGYSKDAKVPPVMFTLDRECIKTYIRALFDTDGCGPGKDPTKLSSASLELLKGVQKLLFVKFGIETRIRYNGNEEHDLIIRGNSRPYIYFNSWRFYHEISFLHPEKRIKLESYIERRTVYKTLRLVNQGYKTSSRVRDKLKLNWGTVIDNLNTLERFGLIDKTKSECGNGYIWHINDFGEKMLC